MPKSLKFKHRDRLWLDADGFLWIYEPTTALWSMYNYDPVDGFFIEQATPKKCYGPYRAM